MTSYASLRKSKLMTLIAERGIEIAWESRPTKADLVAALEAWDHSDATPATPPPRSGAVLERPEGMTDEGVKLWDDLAPRMEAQGKAIREDSMMLACFCEATAAANRVRQGLRAPIVTNANGRVSVSPALAAWEKSTLTALRLAEHFGWTPLARARMGIADPPEEGADTSAPRTLYSSGDA